MTLKIIGAILIIIGCGGFGILLAVNHKKEVFSLEQLIHALSYMENELNYQHSPLPELCKNAANVCKGVVHTALLTISLELESQMSPNVQNCVEAAISKIRDMPKFAKEMFIQLASGFGVFDLQGQSKAIASVRDACNELLNEITKNQEIRLRSYKTLGICAGAALVILFI